MKELQINIVRSDSEVGLLFQLLEDLEDTERSWLDRSSKYSIHIARLISLACILLLTYFFTLLIPIVIGTVLEHFYNYANAEYKYLWAFSLLIFMPISIPIFTNWMDKEYCYSSIVVDLFETVVFLRENTRSIKSRFEIIFFLIYVVFNTIITFFAVANFVEEKSLINFVKSDSISFFSLILAIHMLIYIIVRILLLPNKTIQQKYRKLSREVMLWFFVLLVGFSYMIHKLLSSFSTIDMLYLLGAILVAFVRFITSYKDLRKIIVEIKENASLFM